MARYVMANRRAGKFLDVQKTASRAALEVGFSNLFAASVNVVNDLAPTDELARRVVVFDADPEEVSAKAVTLPTDVIVEPEILHFPVGGSRGKARPVAPATDRSALSAPAVNPAALAGAPLATLADVTAAPTFTIGVTGSGAPLHGAEVMLFLAGVREPVSSLTAANGVASFSLPPGSQVGAAVASPAGGHWSMVSRSPANGSTIDCLPFQSVGPIDWWHRQLGVVTFDPTRGSGIRIGVIDSGVGPHGCLAHAIRAGAFINGGHDPAGGADVDSHGTHVSGLIGARPVGAADRGGIAPGAGLFVARVFPAPHQGASQADIANAIDHLSRTLHTDLINLSLGAPQPSLDLAGRDSGRGRAGNAVRVRGGQQPRTGRVPGRLSGGHCGVGAGAAGHVAEGFGLSAEYADRSGQTRCCGRVSRGLQLLRPGGRHDCAGSGHDLDGARAVRTDAALCGHGRHVDGQPAGVRRARRTPRTLAEVSVAHWRGAHGRGASHARSQLRERWAGRDVPGPWHPPRALGTMEA